MIKRDRETEYYFWVSFGLALLTNRLVFPIGHALSQGRAHVSLALPIDAQIPFLPWTIIIYCGCFAFWFLVYRLVAGFPREEADRFFCANQLGKGICLLFFIFLPATIDRPVFSDVTIWDRLVHFLYSTDTPDNLFPSIHCMIAWLCWVCMRGNRKVSLSWRISALVMAVLVCVSTLTVRQHVLADVIGGILLSELCWLLAGLPALHGGYGVIAERFVRLLYRLFPVHS